MVIAWPYGHARKVRLIGLGGSSGTYSLVYRSSDETTSSTAVADQTTPDSSALPPRTPHVLTVDLEDWHQLFFRQVTGGSREVSRNVVADTELVLELLAQSHTSATFFVVGMVASAFPELVRRVADAGHEIGCHTFDHRLLYALQPSELKADIERSRASLQDLCGQAVLSFRAPAFSVGSLRNEAFFTTLAEAGFECDSSVFPVAGLRYGIPEAPPRPFVIETGSGPIHEFPLATWSLHGVRLPVAGGTYFRFMPGRFLEHVATGLDADGETCTFYVHPYEFHHGLLHVSGLTWHDRLHAPYARHIILHNLFTASICERWGALLARHRFVSIGELHDSGSFAD